MKAFILDLKRQRVQIGDKVYEVGTGKIETARANRKGIFEECEYFVEVPFKSIAGARLAITLVEQHPSKYR